MVKLKKRFVSGIAVINDNTIKEIVFIIISYTYGESHVP